MKAENSELVKENSELVKETYLVQEEKDELVAANEKLKRKSKTK